MAMQRRKKQRRQRPRVSGNRAVTPERKYLSASASIHGPAIGGRMRQSAARQRTRRRRRRNEGRYAKAVNRGKSFSVPSEDSVSPQLAKRLRRKGYKYAPRQLSKGGSWIPPSRQLRGSPWWKRGMNDEPRVT